jgi:hypothetical protein
VLDLFEIDTDKTKRWGEDLKGGKRKPVSAKAAKQKPTKPTQH